MANIKKLIEEQFTAEIKGLIEKGTRAVSNSEIVAVGNEVIDMMKDRISKGISPIKGNGRFPAYKAAGNVRELKKQARQIKDPTRRKKFEKQIQEAQADARLGYPYSVQKKYPNKRVTPVNLELSGDFLDALVATASKSPGIIRLEIGFIDPKEAAKEQGHREGANGQPQRPIIPQGNERFTPEIELKMFDKFRDMLLRILSRQKGS